MTNNDPTAHSPAPEPQGLRREWQAFWLALGFLTRVPMLARITYSQTLMNQSSVYFPLVGLLLGGLSAILFGLLTPALSPLAALLLVIIAQLWITGAFHEDGLADSIDALGGGHTVEDRLRIMKDSRIGTYGTVALVLALALKVALLLDTPAIWLALLVTPCVARLTPLLLMYFMTYVTTNDTSRSKPVAEAFAGTRLLAAGGFVLAAVLALSAWSPYLPLWALLAVAVVALTWGWNLRRSLGGYTGDALGASVVFTELLLLLALAF